MRRLCWPSLMTRKKSSPGSPRWISARPNWCVAYGFPHHGGAENGLQEVSTHSTMTASLIELANQLVELGVQRVVMEATSDYWKPVFYLLEAHGLRSVAGQRARRQAPARPAQNRRA